MEVCSGKTLHASCTSGTVLMINNAVYGRMRIGTCRVSTAGCSADVKSYVERHCAGRRSCEMQVADEIRLNASDNHGCSSDLLGYLQVTYYCLPGKRSLLLLYACLIYFAPHYYYFFDRSRCLIGVQLIFPWPSSCLHRVSKKTFLRCWRGIFFQVLYAFPNEHRQFLSTGCAARDWIYII